MNKKHLCTFFIVKWTLKEKKFIIFINVEGQVTSHFSMFFVVEYAFITLIKHQEGKTSFSYILFS